MVGCASPGPPLPPSLNLPAVVRADSFTATRAGDTVQLHWTTPERTTDKLLIKGSITAVICRDTPSSGLARPGKPAPCSAVQREQVTPGPIEAVDPLPNALAAGPARLVAYRIELLNSAGHTAGPSAEVLVAAGAAPASVADFRAEPTRNGVLLHWQANPGTDESIELERTTVQPPAAKSAPPPAAPARDNVPAGLPGAGKEPAIVRFAAGATDAGGTLDRTARIGRTYTYSAQRVRTVQLAGQTYELRSASSALVSVEVRDIFPPSVPTGLVAVPGYAVEGQAQRPAIDLSWEPDVEPRVGGYRVYRREGDAGQWQRLGTDLVPVPSWRDVAVTAGHTYTYRVTAVSDAGSESIPSSAVTETAPQP